MVTNFGANLQLVTSNLEQLSLVLQRALRVRLYQIPIALNKKVQWLL